MNNDKLDEVPATQRPHCRVISADGCATGASVPR